jgi:hypothetical protein
MRCFCLLVVLALFPLPSLAATYYVAPPPAGDNARSCGTAQNINTPKQSVNSGLGCLSGAGDTLFIRAGTYTELILRTAYPNGSSWNNPTPGGSVVWVGAYNNNGTYENVTIQWGSNVDGTLIMADKSYVVWDHLHIHGTNSQSSVISAGGGTQWFINGEVTLSSTNEYGGPTCTTPYNDRNGILVIINHNQEYSPYVAPGMRFANNYMHDNPCHYAFYGQGMTGGDLIENNIIANNAGYGIQWYTGADTCRTHGGPPCFNNLVIRNNVIYGSGYGISSDNGLPNHQCAMTISESGNAQIYNNVMYNNFCGIDIARESVNGLIAYNTFNNNPADNALATVQVGASASGIQIRNNISYQSGNQMVGGSGVGPPPGGYTASNNLFGTDPKFVNAAGGNFHLQVGSPAIGNAACLTQVTVDRDGVSRTAPCDMGAYESGGVVLPSPTNLRLLSTTIQ